jgi:tetratricopeptide (TPR) repeat protein
MRSSLVLATIVLVAAAESASAQGLPDLRKLYDAGQYQQVIDGANRSEVASDPRVMYLVAQSQQKLSRPDEARRTYGQLVERGEADPWHGVGRSAVALMDSNAADAVGAANQAVEKNGSMPEAHFQRGLALSARQEMAGAAAAFEKASELDPTWAYAHYYAGLAYSRVRRIDRTASHFDRFLKLAPQAPERAEVQSIMRTLGGRH